MCISDTERSLVILSRTKSFQVLQIDVPILAKEVEATRDVEINPHNFNQFYTENLDALKTLRIKRDRQ